MLQQKDETEIISVIAAHYLRNTVCLSFIDIEVHNISVDEIAVFFSARTEDDIHRYLLTKLHDDVDWDFRGWCHPTKVSIARTSIEFMAHWSVLERIFLLKLNRTRLDFLVNIIAMRLLPKMHNDYHALDLGLKKPFWWK